MKNLKHLDIEEIENLYPNNKTEHYLTTNRSVFNKWHKEQKARCARCAWNRGCNETNKWYGGYIRNLRIRWINNLVYDESMEKTNGYKTKYPNWKLCTKNKYQWEDKELKKDFSKFCQTTYTFTFKKLKWKN